MQVEPDWQSDSRRRVGGLSGVFFPFSRGARAARCRCGRAHGLILRVCGDGRGEEDGGKGKGTAKRGQRQTRTVVSALFLSALLPVRVRRATTADGRRPLPQLTPVAQSVRKKKKKRLSVLSPFFFSLSLLLLGFLSFRRRRSALLSGGCATGNRCAAIALYTCCFFYCSKTSTLCLSLLSLLSLSLSLSLSLTLFFCTVRSFLLSSLFRSSSPLLLASSPAPQAHLCLNGRQLGDSGGVVATQPARVHARVDHLHHCCARAVGVREMEGERERVRERGRVE